MTDVKRPVTFASKDKNSRLLQVRISHIRRSATYPNNILTLVSSKLGNTRKYTKTASHGVYCRPREFSDCVAHMRLLSWLLLGALTHTALHSSPCLPVPQEAACHIADHVQVIMAGFAEQSKSSVLHMSSLFHAFVLCQVSHCRTCSIHHSVVMLL